MSNLMIPLKEVEEVGEAIGRLVAIANTDTGQARRVADFLLAWWNGPENGHFPILHLCNCDRSITDDMLTIMTFLAKMPPMYATDWGYRNAMIKLVEDWRR